MEKRIFDIKEAAHYLGRTVGALREMVWAGKLDIIRDGRRILFDKLDLDSWIEKHRTRYTP